MGGGTSPATRPLQELSTVLSWQHYQSHFTWMFWTIFDGSGIEPGWIVSQTIIQTTRLSRLLPFLEHDDAVFLNIRHINLFNQLLSPRVVSLHSVSDVSVEEPSFVIVWVIFCSMIPAERKNIISIIRKSLINQLIIKRILKFRIKKTLFSLCFT